MPVTEYYWDELSDNVLMEADENGDPTAVYTNEPGQFGELVSQERGGVESFYHFDGQGSTRELTDPSEAVTDEYTYTAFGETVASSGNSVSPFQYKGEVGYYSNPETGALYVRRRTYEPLSARWLAMDPRSNVIIGLSPGPFLYSNNSPINQLDPSGLFGQKVAGAGAIKGLFPRNPYHGPCMSHALVTEWIMNSDTDESDGYIVQRVEMSGTLHFCEGRPESILDHVCPFKVGSNMRNCEFKKDKLLGETGVVFRYEYLELWRVWGSKVYTSDVFMNVPKGENPRDAFAHFGFDVSTRGGVTKKGRAYFVPESKMTDAMLLRMKAVFETGERGVKDAYDLYSACLDDADAGKVFVDLVQLAGGTAADLYKETRKRWDCCPCSTRKSAFTYKVGKSESIEVDIRDAELEKTTDC